MSIVWHVLPDVCGHMYKCHRHMYTYETIDMCDMCLRCGNSLFDKNATRFWSEPTCPEDQFQSKTKHYLQTSTAYRPLHVHQVQI